MMMRAFFVGMFMMILSSQAIAEVKLTDEKGQAIAWPAKEEFFTNNEGFRQYGVTIEIPDVASGTEIGIENGTTGPVGNKTTWFLSNYDDAITYTNKSGAEKKITAKWVPVGKNIIVERCQTNSARVQLKDPKVPLTFPLAVSCDNSQKTLNITLSAPAQIEWMDSTLFEVAGKGEPWRSYNLPATSPKGGAIGTISLRNGDKEFILELITPKNIDLAKKEALNKVQQQQASQFQQAIYIGKMDLSYTADPVTAEDSKYFVKYSVLSPKLFGFLKWGGEFKTSFAPSPKEEAVDLLSYNAHLGLHYDYKNQLDLGLRGIFSNITVQQKSSTAKLTSSQIGYGLYADYLFDPKNRVLARVNMVGMNSEVVKSHMEYGLEYRRQVTINKSALWFGLGYNTEKYTAQTPAGLNREFKDTEIQLVIGF